MKKGLFMLLFSVVLVVSSVEGKSPGVAMLLSGIAPGAGQFYNGDNVKGAICLTATAISIGFITHRTVETKYNPSEDSPVGITKVHNPHIKVGLGILAANWIFSVADAGLTCWMKNVKPGLGMDLQLNGDKAKVELTYKF